MAIKPFFDDAENSYFDKGGMPSKPGIYEFRSYDGRKILYTLDFMDQEEGEAPRLKVVHASRMADYPYPAHALNTLDGDWERFVGLPSEPERPTEAEGPSKVEGTPEAEAGP